MNKLTLIRFVMLDGVVRLPGGPHEGSSGAFDHGGLSFGYRDEQKERAMGGSLSQPSDPSFVRESCENDDRGTPDARAGPRYCGEQSWLSASGFPADR